MDTRRNMSRSREDIELQDVKPGGPNYPVPAPRSQSQTQNYPVAAPRSRAASIDDELDVDPNAAQRLPMMPRDPLAGLQTGEPLDSTTTQVNKLKMDEAEEQPSPTTPLAWVGFGCGVFALAALCIAFASPYWIQTYPNSFNTFQNIGLWEVCFSDYMHHRDDSQEVYNGCWWVFNREPKYWKLREWILPPWFISCEVMVTMSLMVSVGATVCVALIFLHMCPIMNHEYHQTYGMFGACALQALGTMICLIASVVFGAMCGDRQWMPRPDLNLISWGFGFYVIYGIMNAISAVCYYMAATKAFDELIKRDDEYTKAVFEASQATFPMYGTQPSYSEYNDQPYDEYGQKPSYGEPSYNEPSGSYGQPQGSYDQPQDSYGKDSYGKDSYDKQDPSYTTQPSYHSQHSYGGDLPPKSAMI